MPDTRVCSECGSALPPNLFEGLCPNCIARSAFGATMQTPAIAEPARAAPLRKFGDYELLEEIARGGMGVVFKARQVSLNRVVAVKMILAGQLASTAEVQRFRAEAKAAASLQHPNIVAIHEVGEHEGLHFFSMDYVEGQSLAQWSAACKVRDAEWFRRAAAQVKIIAEAIHYAHQQGTLHRDLKPSNILIDSFGQPRITDFGLAKRLTDSQLSTHNPQLTLTGQVLGTPNFMPPEQAGAGRSEVGPQSDVYSLGAVLYFLLTGRPPFAAETLQATLARLASVDPVAPRKLVPTVPRDLDTICVKCLEKVPQRRYASAQELADELGRFLRDEPILARPVGQAQKAWRWCRRHPAVASLAVSLTLTLGLSLVVIALLAQRGRLPELGRRADQASSGANERSRLAPIPVLSGRGASGFIAGKLYVTSPADGYAGEPGNRNWFHAYDPFNNQWSKLPGTPTIHVYPSYGVIDRKFYLVAGKDEKGDLNRQLDIYDPEPNEWSVGAPLPTPRLGAAGAVFGGKLYVLGGTDGTNVLKKVEIYDPATSRWTDGPEMTAPRTSFGAAVLNGILYVLGGWGPELKDPVSGQVAPLRTMEALTSNGVWVAQSSMDMAVSQFFVAVVDNVLYVAGGRSSAETPLLQVYHPTTASWDSSLPAMPEAREDGSGAHAISGLLYCIGGWTSPAKPLYTSSRKGLPHDEIFVFDTHRYSWATDSLLITNTTWPGRIAPHPLLTGCGLSGVIDDKLYVTSPCDGQAGHRQHFHSYDPTENRWSHALPASPEVHAAGAGGVIDGKFYLAGGIDSKGRIHGSLDVYHPAVTNWQTNATMHLPRAHTAGAVLDGKLYVLGGNDGTNLSRAVEMFDPKTSHWSDGPSLPTALEDLGAAVIERTLYVVGGRGADGHPTTTLLALAADGKWQTKRPMPLAVSGAFIAALNGAVYVVGGRTATGEVRDLQAYFPRKNGWEKLAPLPGGRHGGCGAQPLNGELYVIGGWSGQPPSLHDDLFAYDPRRKAWRR